MMIFGHDAPIFYVSCMERPWGFTIVVSVPKEEEEIVDVGVRPKKRGRPRKAPSMDPPDPRKGSVLDPGKVVCADPVNGGAILGKGGPDPQGRNKECQLSPDKGREKT
jgi:hypothetical protein